MFLACYVSECIPFALLQTSWIQCLCPSWILAAGSLRESWPHWQRSLLMSSKRTCSYPPKSTAGQARPLPSSTRWGESLLIRTITASLLISLPAAQLCEESCCLLKEVNRCDCLMCSCSQANQCQHFQKLKWVMQWETEAESLATGLAQSCSVITGKYSGWWSESSRKLQSISCFSL